MLTVRRFVASAVLALLGLVPPQQAHGSVKPRETRQTRLAIGAAATSCDVGPTSSLCIPVDSTFRVVAFTDSTCSFVDPADPCSRNDDSFTAAIDLPFTFHLYGQPYTRLFVNNNGNVSFGGGFCAFSSAGFPVAGPAVVAPFWADVDTRNPASGVVHYRLDAHKLVVAWDHVGYFSEQADRLNTFEVILSDGADPAVPPGSNVCFCFGGMQWTTGSASDGIGGFGGIPATVGVNAGDGVHFFQIGRFDHAGTDYDGPGGANDGVNYLENQRFCANVSGTNIPPVAIGFPASLVDSVCAGDSLVVNTSFAAPELDQAAVTSVDLGGLANATATSVSGNLSTQRLVFHPAASQAGTHAVRYVAVDDGVPPDTTTVDLSFVVTNCHRCLPANHAPNFLAPTPPGGGAAQALVGEAMTLQVRASDADSLDTVTLSAAGLPGGATLVPALPAAGNPAWTTLSWTPAAADTGLRTVTFTAGDGCDSAVCVISIRVLARTVCPRSADEWARHEDAWPADSLRLGARAYGHDMLARFLAGGRRGRHEHESDFTALGMAGQLVAAKFNLLAGAGAPGADSLVARADSLIGDHALPCGIRCGGCAHGEGATAAAGAKGESSGDAGAGDCTRWLLPFEQVTAALGGFNSGHMAANCSGGHRQGEGRGEGEHSALTGPGATTGAAEFSADARPNPFLGATAIAYTLPDDADVRIAVYDLQGRELRVLAEGRMAAGAHQAAWDGTDASGRRVRSGAYFYLVTAGRRTSGKKLFLRQ